MKSESKNIRFITRAAMGVALVILAQLAGKLFPAGAFIAGPFSVNQLVTGSLVNCVLFVFTAIGGVWCGVCVGILSAVLASVIGIGPAVLAVVPLVACGNAILCIVFSIVGKPLPRIVAVITAAAVKCGFLWISVPLLLQAICAPDKQRMMLGIMFSWPQACTALIGGLLAMLIIPRISKDKAE